MFPRVAASGRYVHNNQNVTFVSGQGNVFTFDVLDGEVVHSFGVLPGIVRHALEQNSDSNNCDLFIFQKCLTQDYEHNISKIYLRLESQTTSPSNPTEGRAEEIEE